MTPHDEDAEGTLAAVASPKGAPKTSRPLKKLCKAKTPFPDSSEEEEAEKNQANTEKVLSVDGGGTAAEAAAPASTEEVISGSLPATDETATMPPDGAGSGVVTIAETTDQANESAEERPPARTSPKTTRKTTNRRRSTKEAPMKPGKANDAASFVNKDNPEATIAAYCGCRDISAFRRFYTSALVLPYYLKSVKYRGYARRIVLSLLGDVPYDQYWASDKDAEEVYPITDTDERDTNLNYGMGLILWQMLRGIRKGLSKRSPKIDETEFTKLTGRKLPKASPLKPEEKPNFGPFEEDGECEVEALNRCLCLLQHFKYITSKSQWERRFFSATPWDAPKEILDDFAPDWMRNPESVALEAPDEFTGSASVEESQTMTVTWKHASKHKKNAAYVGKLKEEDVFSEVPKTVTLTITASMLGAEVRDRVREAFKVHEYDGQLEQLTLLCGEEEVAALNADWDGIFKDLQQHTGATFSCLLRERDDAESPWEYGGPPVTLRGFLDVQQDDVAPKQHQAPEETERVQRQIFQLTVPKLETPFEPLKLFGNDKDRLKKAYGGFDVSTPEGRQDWQLKYLPRLAGTDPVRYVEDGKLKEFRKYSEALNAAQTDGVMQAVDLEQAQDNDGDAKQALYEVGRKRYYAYQTAIGGTAASAGPPIETSARALRMKLVKGAEEEQYEYTQYSKEQVKRYPKPYQVNGAAWGLSTLFGEIRFNEDNVPNNVRSAATKLKRLEVPGLFYFDQTGLGKSVQSLQVALGLGRPFTRYLATGKLTHKPMMLLAPQNLIRQWAREILFHWKVFTLVISYDDGAMEPFLAEHVVSSSAVRSWPKKRLWPKKYHYMFDEFDPRNARTIVLTTPETNVERSLVAEEIVHPAKSFDPPQFDEDRNEIYETKQWVETKYHSRFADVYAAVFIAESTKVKTPGSKRHMAVKLLNARRWIFMTATAMMNQGTVSDEESSFWKSRS